MIDYLSKVVTNRDALNEHVREWPTLALGQDVESPEQREYSWDYESWSDDELDPVLNNGLDVLSDERLAWLRFNPIALFELFDAINEFLPSPWSDLVLADAKRLWNERPKAPEPRGNEDTPASNDQKRADEYSGLEDTDEFEPPAKALSRLVTNRDALVEHIRELQGESRELATDCWSEAELQRALDEGLECLPKKRLTWMRDNPVALFELFDAINESLPPCWMDLVLADARRLRDSRPDAGQ